MTAAVGAAKKALAAATGLAHPLPHAQLALVTDASDSHVGGVLQQRERVAWCPLSFFFTEVVAGAESLFSFDRKLTTVFSALQHFRFMLEGRQFHIMTDHKPLVAAFGQVSLPCSARQHGQLAYIMEYTTDNLHTPGASNPIADVLSQPGLLSAPPPLGLALRCMLLLHLRLHLLLPLHTHLLTPLQPFITAIPDLAAFVATQRTCPEVGLMRQSPSLALFVG
jgi:RNase H-like domain found in reverse transcriptase